MANLETHYSNRPIAVSPAEAARMLGLGKTKLYSLLAENQLTSIKIGARRLIRVSAIEAFLDRLAAEG
jgi:excisionase family DNA binding protein